MNLTKKETAIIIALLLGLIAGGIFRLYKKGWTPAGEEPSMSTPATPANR